MEFYNKIYITEYCISSKNNFFLLPVDIYSTHHIHAISPTAGRLQFPILTLPKSLPLGGVKTPSLS